MPLHAKFRASTSLLLLAAVAFGVALAALSGSQAALAGSTGILVPVSQGYYSGWNESGGGSEVAAIDDGTCGAGDGFWITGQYYTNQSSSYTLDLSSVPFNAPIRDLAVTVCYSDADGTDLLQTVTPFVRVAGADTPGTGIDPKGSTTMQSTTQHFYATGWLRTTPVEIGLKDVGFIGRVKVHAMWAVATYDPPPTFTMENTTLAGVAPPYPQGQTFDWQSVVTISQTNSYPAELIHTWDPAVFGTAVTASYSGPGVMHCSGGSQLSCTFGSYVKGTFTFYVRLQVKSAEACSSQSSITVNLNTPEGPVLVLQAHPTVSLNGGCATPTPTATATSPATSAPTSATTSASSIPTATGTSALSTSTPTSTGTTGSNTSTTTPGTGTATPTATPTSTGTPSVPKPYHLRAMELARDGSN